MTLLIIDLESRRCDIGHGFGVFDLLRAVDNWRGRPVKSKKCLTHIRGALSFPSSQVSSLYLSLDISRTLLNNFATLYCRQPRQHLRWGLSRRLPQTWSQRPPLPSQPPQEPIPQRRHLFSGERPRVGLGCRCLAWAGAEGRSLATRGMARIFSMNPYQRTAPPRR